MYNEHINSELYIIVVNGPYKLKSKLNQNILKDSRKALKALYILKCSFTIDFFLCCLLIGLTKRQKGETFSGI